MRSFRFPTSINVKSSLSRRSLELWENQHTHRKLGHLVKNELVPINYFDHWYHLLGTRCIIFSFLSFFILIVVQIQMPPFSPHVTPCTHPCLPPLKLHLWLCPCVLYMCSLMDLHYPSLPSPLDTVSLLFNTSKQNITRYTISNKIL